MKNFIKQIIKESIIKYLKEQQIFEEIEISDYRIVKSDDEQYYGYFTINGLKYTVSIYHEDNKHKFGVWEVEFSVQNQTSAGYRTKKDIKHLNSVLYTVSNILKEIVENNNIKQIYIDSANDEFDDNNLNTKRGDIYYRFLKNNFKNNKIERYGRFINIYFSDEKNIKLDIIKNILIDISNNHVDIDGLNRGIGGTDDNNFRISTDFISNVNVGDIYFEIVINVKNNVFMLSYHILDNDEQESFDFNSFNELVKFLKEFKEKINNL